MLGLDLLLDPPVGSEVRDINLPGRTCTTSEGSDNATIPGEDDGPRVTSTRKLATFLVVGQDSELDGGVFDAVVIVCADEGLETIDATDGCPRDQPILHDEQAILTVYIEVLGSRNSSSWTTPLA